MNMTPVPPAVPLLDMDIMLISVISDAKRGSKFYNAGIRNFYLNNPMPHTGI